MGSDISCEVLNIKQETAKGHEDSAYGWVTLFEREQGLIATKQLTFSNAEEMLDYKKYAEGINAKNLPSLMHIQRCKRVSGNMICNVYSLAIEFKYIPKTLRKILNRRCSSLLKLFKQSPQLVSSLCSPPLTTPSLQPSQRKYLSNLYSQPQIFGLLGQLLFALMCTSSVCESSHLEFSHSLSPDSLVVNDNGDYVIIDRVLMREQNNYESSLTKELVEGVYLAPEEWVGLSDKQHRIPDEKSAVFVLGLMALEMGLLGSPEIFIQGKTVGLLERLYDRRSYEFDTNALNKYILMLGQRYTPALTDLLKKMTTTNPKNRCTLQQTYSFVSAYLKELQTMNSELSSKLTNKMNQPQTLKKLKLSRFDSKRQSFDDSGHLRISSMLTDRKPSFDKEISRDELFQLFASEYKQVKQNRLRKTDR